MRRSHVAVVSLVLPALGMSLAAGACPAQTAPASFDFATTLRLPSAALGEERILDVALPASYERAGDRRYPVLYVLDGESQFPVAAALARFYASVGQLPELIVIGLRNTERTRNLTPAPAGGWRLPPGAADGGGAATFLQFMEQELAPFVDRTYRTAPMRVLAGHSLGGLFALYTLAQRPQLFTGFLVMDPSVWWNNQLHLDEARSALARPEARRARVMLFNSPWLGVDTTQWGGSRGPMVRHFRTPGEVHGSMPVQALVTGLRSLFADFLPLEWRPGLRPIALLTRYDSLTDRVGYAVPVPPALLTTLAQLAMRGRFFEDAEEAIRRLERAGGAAPQVRALRDSLAAERAQPADGFVPLEVPARRPTPREAAAYLGIWRGSLNTDAPGPANDREFTIAASGDTITMTTRQRFPNGEVREGATLVLQVRRDGAIEWAVPLRGIPGAQVYVGRIQADGALTGTEEIRGFAVPAAWRRPPPSFRFERMR